MLLSDFRYESNVRYTMFVSVSLLPRHRTRVDRKHLRDVRRERAGRMLHNRLGVVQQPCGRGGEFFGRRASEHGLRAEGGG